MLALMVAGVLMGCESEPEPVETSDRADPLCWEAAGGRELVAEVLGLEPEQVSSNGVVTLRAGPPGLPDISCGFGLGHDRPLSVGAWNRALEGETDALGGGWERRVLQVEPDERFLGGARIDERYAGDPPYWVAVAVRPAPHLPDRWVGTYLEIGRLDGRDGAADVVRLSDASIAFLEGHLDDTSAEDSGRG
jgi:hypothetical protein